jgi:hypothetical protein
MQTIGAKVYGPFPEPPSLIDAETYSQLLYWHGRLGNAWTKIGNMVKLTPCTCKNIIARMKQSEKNREFMGEPTAEFDIDW